MTRKILAASLIALGLFTIPVFAEGTFQGATRAQQSPELLALIKKVRRFLSDGGNVKDLGDEELKSRYSTAKDYAASPDLPEDLRKGLQRQTSVMRNEILARRAAAKVKPRRATENDVSQNEQPAERRKRPSDVVESGGEAEQPAKPRRPVAENEQDQGELLPNKKRRPSDVAETEGGQEEPAKPRGVIEESQKGVIVAEPAQPRRSTIQSDAANNPDERSARKILQDNRDASRLNDQDLRRRLNLARRLLESSRLTDRTESQLRNLARSDRDVVRKRQAEREQARNDRDKPKRDKSKINVDINIDLRPNTVVLRDRRRANELTEVELQQRIRVYRDVETDPGYNRYDEAERRYWRDQLVQDREYLRRRLLEERRQREIEEERDREIVIDVRPRAVEPDEEIDVFAAEADERQIEDVLVAAPRERVTRRYQVDEVANDRNLRRSIPRIEVDTIRFGFNESIVREEEVNKLDQIGAVIERILRKHPREVFIIEGHTDAVGSDSYNLALSRARADAVKQALTTYFAISPRNLRTVGLGERFLKIQTDESEAENRRVSIGRITAYVGESG